MSSKVLLQQVWRFVRLFAAAFVAQLYLAPSLKLDSRVLIAAAIGAVESVYRQLSPAGSARVIGTLATVLGYLARTAQQPASAAPGAPKPAPASSKPSVVAEAAQAATELAQGGIIPKPVLTVVADAEKVAAQVSSAISEVPTGPDGMPVASAVQGPLVR